MNNGNGKSDEKTNEDDNSGKMTPAEKENFSHGNF